MRNLQGDSRTLGVLQGVVEAHTHCLRHRTGSPQQALIHSSATTSQPPWSRALVLLSTGRSELPPFSRVCAEPRLHSELL